MKTRAAVRALVGLLLLTSVVPLAGCFNGIPLASFTVSGDLRPRVEISFVNTSTDPNGIADIRMCHWSFGDGSYDDNFNASHIYGTAGTYTVRLTVYDGQNEAATCEREIDVRSRIFGLPDHELAVVGSSWASGGPFGAYIPENRRYPYSESTRLWTVAYFLNVQTGEMTPSNVVFWLPVPLSQDLNQSVLLTLSWRLMTHDERTVYRYDDPSKYPLGATTKVTGINAVWDLWHQTAYGAALSAGDYKTRLQITDELSGERFIWDFPFRICWGGC